MDSWRITVKSQDLSSVAIADIGEVGAMVIRAEKGPSKPRLIDQGDIDRIKTLYGEPSADYPDVWEVMQYAKNAQIWVSAPFPSTDTYGGVLLTSSGTVALGAGLTPAALDSYTFSANTDYCLLSAVSPYADDLGIKTTYDSTNERFTIKVYKKDSSGSFVEKEEHIVSLEEDAKDDFGKNIYIENILDGNDYIQPTVNASNSLATNGFVDDSATVALAGGSRTAGSSITITDLTEGWDYFQQKNTYPADVFMDNTAISGIVDLFSTLSTTYQKYASYILPLPAGENASTAIATKAGYSVNNANLAFYWNHGKVQYGSKKFWTSLVGRVGERFAAMEDVYNGLAPAFINENNHGGQLGTSIVEMEYDPSESDLESLYDAGINPIIFDPGYGVMITSHKTAQTPTTLSDYSWVPHVRVFNYLKKNIIDQVLVYQLTKLNDSAHRDQARIKAEAIVNPVVDEGLLTEATVVCDETNNTDAILAQRKFIIDVVVKVTPFSETITLNFVNIAQTTTVDEFISS